MEFRDLFGLCPARVCSLQTLGSGQRCEQSRMDPGVTSYGVHVPLCAGGRHAGNFVTDSDVVGEIAQSFAQAEPLPR
jgi:hypothetical protein